MRKLECRREALFQYRGLPPVGMAVSMALQHLVAMIVGCVTPAIIIANVAGLAHDQRVLLIQASLVMSAVTTLLQLFPIGGRFGAGLPVIFGVSFAYLPSMQAIVSGSGGLAAVSGAMIVGGAVAALVGIFIKPIRRLFPPVITGTVVFTIGLSLYPTAINYMAGGTGNTYESVVVQRGLPEALVYGSWQNWAIAAFTLAVVLVLTNHGKGICRLASILLGISLAGIVLDAGGGRTVELGFARPSRGVLLLAVVLLPVLVVNDVGMGDPFFCKYLCPQGVLEGAIPLSLVHSGIRAALGALFTWKCSILLGVVVLSVVFYRPFCKWLCPLGAIYALLNKVSLFQMKVDKRKCISCGKCAQACKMDVDVTQTPNHTECIRCGMCIRACPTNAVSFRYGFGDGKKEPVEPANTLKTEETK